MECPKSCLYRHVRIDFKLSFKIIMACMTIEERGRAVGMVSAGSSLRQVIVLIKNKEAYRQFISFFGSVPPFKLKDLLYSEFVTFQNRFLVITMHTFIHSKHIHTQISTQNNNAYTYKVKHIDAL